MKQVTCSRCDKAPSQGRRVFVTVDAEQVCEACLCKQIAGMKWQRPVEFSVLAWLSANVVGIRQGPR
jgi:hypothetical protein